MRLLAVETATEACSCALLIDHEVEEKFQLAPQRHTRLILPMIDALLAEAGIQVHDLDAVAFGRGPGSFTGIRIATGVVHGIAFGADLPVIPISTLAAIAQDCIEQTGNDYIFTAMDARMGEIYWAEYQKSRQGHVQLVARESVDRVENVTVAGSSGFGAGSAWQTYHAQLIQHLGCQISGFDSSYLPRASKIAQLAALEVEQGRAVPVEQAMPVYLRDKVAKKESER